MKKHIFTMTDEEYENALEEVLIDAYGDVEQVASFCVYLQDEVKLPIYGSIAGGKAKITDFANNNSRVLALVKLASKRYEIDLMSVEFKSIPLPIAVYKRWRVGW